MSNILLVIQARMGSRRFPGKMMAPLGGIPLIDWLLDRMARVRNASCVVLATSDRKENAPLASRAESRGVIVYQGAESDVLSRFTAVANQYEAAHVIRICGDNPLTAPEEVDRAVHAHIVSDADYTFNATPRFDTCYPDGLGCEVFRASILLSLDTPDASAETREHVNPTLWAHPTRFRFQALRAPNAIAAPSLRFDVDTPQDLERLEKLVRAHVLTTASTAEAIVRAALAEQEKTRA